MSTTILTKYAARYNSQPTLPQGGMGGFNNMGRSSSVFPFTMGTNLGAAANAAQQNPNPLAQLPAPKPGLATAGGIQQMAQKTAHGDPFEALLAVLYPLVKRSEVATGGSSAPAASGSSLGGGASGGVGGAGKGGFGTPAGPVGSQQANQAGQSGQGGGMNGGASGAMNGALGGGVGGQVGAFGLVRPGWNALRPAQPASPNLAKTASWLQKLAQMIGQPVPGQTANAPMPQPGMAPTQAPMMPPPGGGAPVPMGMGQGSVDPATGQPTQPPAPGQQGAPPQGGQMPAPGQPGAPPTAPMQDPPPQPLPANPRMMPPRPPTPHDQMSNSLMGSLGADMDNAERPMSEGEAEHDMESQALAMGSKTAADAISSIPWVLVNPNSAFEFADPFSDAVGYRMRLMAELGEKAAAILPFNAVGNEFKLNEGGQLRAPTGGPALAPQAANPAATLAPGGAHPDVLAQGARQRWKQTGTYTPYEPVRSNYATAQTGLGATPAPAAPKPTFRAGAKASPDLFGTVSPSGALGKGRVGGTFNPPPPKPLPANFTPTVKAPVGSAERTIGKGGERLISPLAAPPVDATIVPGAKGQAELVAKARAAQAAQAAKLALPALPATAAPVASSAGVDLGARMLARIKAQGGNGTAAAPFSLDPVPAPKPAARPLPPQAKGKLPIKGKLGLLAGAGGLLGLGSLLSKSGGDYTFDAEDCPKCGASMEGDSYTGTCNSCQHHWGTKKAGEELLRSLTTGFVGTADQIAALHARNRVKRAFSLTADEGGEDAPALPGSPMRGWQWKVLQKEQDEAQKAWMPRLFRTGSTPLTELLASPSKQGLLGGLAGGALGGAAGAFANKALPTGQADWQNGLIGGGIGALLGGLTAYGHRRKENDKVTDALRRTPPGATVDDYEAVQLADAAKKKPKAPAQAKVAAALLDPRPSDKDSFSPARSGAGESEGIAYQNKEDQYAKGKDAWDSVSHYFKGHKKRVEQPDPFKGRHSAITKEAKALITKMFTRAPRLASGKPPAPGFSALPKGVKPPTPPAPMAGSQASARTGTYTPAPPPGSTAKPQSTMSNPEATANVSQVGTTMPPARGTTPNTPMGEIQRNFPQLAKWLQGGPRTWTAGGLAGLGGLGAMSMSGGPTGATKMSQDIVLGPTPVPPPRVEPVAEESFTQKPWVLPAAAGGATLLGLSAILMRKKKDKTETDEPADKMAGCTDFARGFFERCDEMGVPYHEAVEKVGSDYGEEAAAELRDGMEKVSTQWIARQGQGAVNFGKGLFGASKAPALPKINPGATLNESIAATRAYSATRAANAATRATGAYQAGAKVSPYVQGLGRPAAVTAAGAAAGGMSGNDLGVFGNDKSGPLGMNTNAMLAGAAAFNPFTRRMAGRAFGGYGSVPLTGLRTGFLGSFGGSGVDQLAGAAGYDTKGQFRQLGGKLGFGYGALRQGGRTAAQNMGANAPGWLTAANRGMVRGEKGIRDFAFGTVDPLFGAAKAVVRKPIQWASGGAYSGGKLLAPGITAGKLGRTITPSIGRAAGRVVGTGSLGLGGLGLGYGYVNDKIDQKVNETVGRVYNEAMPQISEDVAGMLDTYMGERGMLDQQGQFDPSSRMMKGLSGGADSIFRSMGMDPNKLSGLQKVMILGGAMAGGGGMLAGSPVLAGLGGVSAMGGLLPQFMPGQGQQRSMASMGMPGANAPYTPGQAPGFGQTAQGGPFASRNEFEAAQG